MYVDYFNLKQAPFSIAPDPRYLFMSERHREALAHLLYGIKSGGGFVLLTGEIGAGKTTVCRCFIEQVPADCRLAYIFNPKLTVEELLQTICDEFRIQPPDAQGAQAGVKGYVRKDSPPEDLVRAIRAAQSGEFYVDPALSSTIVLEEGDRTLTARQREILQMLADGMQTEAVAKRLGLSTETVRTHTKRILAKLHADTRTQAVAIAIRNGLIE